MNTTSTPIQQKEQTAQFLWTGFILLFFVIQAILWIAAITLTTGDKSHAVLTDYDERALNWDEEVALRQESANLGWKTELTVDHKSDIRGNRLITLKVRDRDDQPVTSATIILNAFHLARAGDPQQIPFTEFEEGTYSGMIQVGKTGIWQFDGKVSLNKNVLLVNERQTLIVSK